MAEINLRDLKYSLEIKLELLDRQIIGMADQVVRNDYTFAVDKFPVRHEIFDEARLTREAIDSVSREIKRRGK